MSENRRLTAVSVLAAALAAFLAPTSAVAGEAPVKVEGDVVAPKVIHKVVPQYTEAARKAHVTGAVILQAIIDETGKVTDTEVLRSLREDLDEVAVQAVRQWQFEPATLDGKPVAVYYNLTINFQLAEKLGLKKVGGSVSEPKAIEKMSPIYPEAARKDKVTGSVRLRLHIDTAGRVSAADVLESVRADIDEAALSATRQWRFEPAIENGEPVAVFYDVTVNFRLE